MSISEIGCLVVSSIFILGAVVFFFFRWLKNNRSNSSIESLKNDTKVDNYEDWDFKWYDRYKLSIEKYEKFILRLDPLIVDIDLIDKIDTINSMRTILHNELRWLKQYDPLNFDLWELLVVDNYDSAIISSEIKVIPLHIEDIIFSIIPDCYNYVNKLRPFSDKVDLWMDDFIKFHIEELISFGKKIQKWNENVKLLDKVIDRGLEINKQFF